MNKAISKVAAASIIVLVVVAAILLIGFLGSTVTCACPAQGVFVQGPNLFINGTFDFVLVSTVGAPSSSNIINVTIGPGGSVISGPANYPLLCVNPRFASIPANARVSESCTIPTDKLPITAGNIYAFAIWLSSEYTGGSVSAQN